MKNLCYTLIFFFFFPILRHFLLIFRCARFFSMFFLFFFLFSQSLCCLKKKVSPYGSLRMCQWEIKGMWRDAKNWELKQMGCVLLFLPDTPLFPLTQPNRVSKFLGKKNKKLESQLFFFLQEKLGCFFDDENTISDVFAMVHRKKKPKKKKYKNISLGLIFSFFFFF